MESACEGRGSLHTGSRLARYGNGCAKSRCEHAAAKDLVQTTRKVVTVSIVAVILNPVHDGSEAPFPFPI